MNNSLQEDLVAKQKAKATYEKLFELNLNNLNYYILIY